MLKALAIALKNEGTEAEFRNSPREAVQSYLDLLRFGHKVQSGLLVSTLFGLAIERMGVDALTQLEPKIDPPLREQVAAQLRTLNSKRPPFSETEAGEKFILRQNSLTPLHFFIMRRAAAPASRHGHSKYQQAQESLEALAAKFDQPNL